MMMGTAVVRHNRKARTLLVAGALFCWLPALSPVAAQQQPAAAISVTSTSGRVEYQRPDGSYRASVSGQILTPGIRLVARAASRAELLVAGVPVTLDELSLVTFTSVDASGGATGSETMIDATLRAGSITFDSAGEGSGDGSSVTVRLAMPGAVVNATDAAFSVNGATVSVTQGAVVVTNDLGISRRIAAGASLLVSPRRRPVAERAASLVPSPPLR